MNLLFYLLSQATPITDDGNLMPLIPTTIGTTQNGDDDFNKNENNATTESTKKCIFGPKICGPITSPFDDFNLINGSTMIPILIQKNSGSFLFTLSSELFVLLMCIVYFRIV